MHHADATDVVLRPGHSEFTWRGQRITTPLTGAINVDNALLAAEAALALEELDLGPEEIARAMAHLAPVPGRLQVIAAPGRRGRRRGASRQSGGPSFTVLVDYAHTPAGLEVVLGEARTLAPAGRVLCVFGCGGNRDRAKRPADGRGGGAAERPGLPDVGQPARRGPAGHHRGGAWLASPAGATNPGVVVEPDRGVAIRLALDAAGPGDVVVIAGKGHETYQEIAGQRLPFDDAVEARRALSVRFGSDPRTWATRRARAASAPRRRRRASALSVALPEA